MADRRNKTIRDMTLSMGILVVVVLAFVFLNGQGAFAPGGPTGGSVPSTDVQQGFSQAQSDTGFAALVPTNIPAGWTPNSFSLVGQHDAGGGSPTARGGWVTPDGTFVTLVESTGTIAQVQQAELGGTHSTSGTIDAGGATWQVTTGVRDEQAWIRAAGGITLLITGSASVPDFTTVAESIAGQ